MDVRKIERKIFDKFALLANELGYSEVHGRIIGALVMADDTLSLEQLSKKTGYAAPTISLSLDMLELLGIVKKQKRPGDRKLYVSIKGELLEGLKKVVFTRMMKSLNETLADFKLYKSELSKGGKEAQRVLKKLLKLEKEIKRLQHYVYTLDKIKL